MRRTFIFSLGLIGVLGLLSGCGGGGSKVNGVVTLDGTPVAGATVVFTSEDGAVTASGMTDDQGKFALSCAGKPEVPHGSFKVTVTKSKIVEGESPALAGEGGGGEKDYLKAMKGSIKKDTGSSGGGPLMPGMPGYRPPASTGGSSDLKSDLPIAYADPSKTPLTVKVPAEGDEVKLELKSK
jgi:hypothetical protein